MPVDRQLCLVIPGAEDLEKESTKVSEARETEVNGAVFDEVEDGAVAKVTTLTTEEVG